MRKLAVVILAALVVAGVAIAGTGEPKKAFTAAGQALARSIVIRRADLPAGFTSSPSNPNSGKLPTCKGFKPDQSDLTQTGKAEAQFEKAGNPPVVLSDADVWVSAAQAQAAFNRVVRPGLSQCLFSLFITELKANAAKGVKYIPVSNSLTALTGLGQQAARVHLVFTGVSGGIRIPLVIDYYAIRKGRVTTLLNTLDLRASYAPGRALAAKLASRMP